MLPRSGFGNDPMLTHTFGKQHLADRVVDLVRTGVREVLALQP